MKGISFNLRDAKKVAGDKQSSTFQLKDGHQIKIAHHSLPELQRKALQRLPLHLADGTPDVEGQAEPTESDLTPVSPDNFQPVKPDPNATPIPVGDTPQIPGIQTPNMAAQPAKEPASTLPEASTNLPDQGAPVGGQQTSDNSEQPKFPDINEEMKVGQQAINEQQAVDTNLAKASANEEQAQVDARKQLMVGAQLNDQHFQAEQQQFMKDYMDNKINPNAYVENMGAAQKVTTAIGILLGGFSAPYSRNGANPALDYLNQQIGRDIEAQKSRLGQQQTILGANQALYHDQVLAQNATRMNMNDIYAHQIQLNADKLGGAAAKAKADAATWQLDQNTLQLRQQSAMRAAVLHSLAQNGGVGVTAQDLSTIGYMSPEQAEKEQSSIDAQKQSIAAVNDIYNKLDDEQTLPNLGNPQSYARVAALKSELVNAIMNSSASKRLTRESVEVEVNPLVEKTLQDPETRLIQRQAALNMVGMHADPTPIMSQRAPGALPKYPFQQANQQTQHKVGDVLRVNGQKVQVTDKNGNYQPVK